MPKGWPKLFVVVDYTCEQNEPSKPFKDLMTAKNLKDLRKQAIEAYKECFVMDEHEYEEDEITFRTGKEANHEWYCDYELTHDSHSFILLTEVKV
jgi:hypothetical protein